MQSPVLYLFVGYPGSGKTTAAQTLASATGAMHLWADKERHARFDAPTHSEAESKELYDALNAQTAALLRAGRSVIFDTNFNHQADRDKLRAIAREAGADIRLLWIQTPLSVAKDRAVHSGQARNGYGSAMSADQFDAIAAKLEAPGDDEQPICISGNPLDQQALLEATA